MTHSFRQALGLSLFLTGLGLWWGLHISNHAGRPPSQAGPGLSSTAASAAAESTDSPTGSNLKGGQRGPTLSRDLPVMESGEGEVRKQEILDRWIEQVPAVDIPTMLNTLQATELTELTGDLFLRLATRWAEQDPEVAANWAIGLRENNLRQAAINQVMNAWGDQNPTAALEWLQGIPPGNSKQGATLSLGYEIARTDPVTALDLAAGLSPSQERDDLLTYSLRQWAYADSAAAQTWAMKVPDPNLEQRLVAAAAVAGAKQDGAQSAMLAATALRPGEEQNRAAISILEQWALSSPGAAYAWASELPDPTAREAALLSLRSMQGEVKTSTP